jgi:Peptidase family M23
MTLIFILQLVLPLFLIAWIALFSLKSKLGFACQIVGTATGLLALSLSGIWIFPPWWSPYAFAVLLVVAVFIGWRKRQPFVSLLPTGWVAWIFTALFIAVGGWGMDQSVRALAGREQQAGVAVALAFPLKGGTFLVVNGGSNLSINAHLMTLDTNILRFQAYRGQSYGVDIVKLDQWGFRAKGLQPTKPDAYVVYGAPVYAPCSGEVVAALDGLPDMPVPQMDREHMAGNHVLLRCKDADVLLGHLKPRSVSVTTGIQVAVGDPIAKVGNTGNTGEPHLHIHAQQRGTVSEPLSGNPLPMRFGGAFLVRNYSMVIP